MALVSNVPVRGVGLWDFLELDGVARNAWCKKSYYMNSDDEKSGF